jgi:uncharacterized membrane protein HdeD (DUF308 family)
MKAKNAMILFSTLFALLGILLICVPQITFLTLCYVCCGVLAAFGIFMIVRYFLKESFRSLNQYGFSVGVLFVLISMCALVKAEIVSSYFIPCLGVLILVSAVFLLQDCLDLIVMKDVLWLLWLILAVLFAVVGILVLFYPFSSTDVQHQFCYYALAADGIVCLLGTLYLHFRIKAFEKKEAKQKEAPQEDNWDAKDIAEQSAVEEVVPSEDVNEENE